MFLAKTLERNKGLIEGAFFLHQKGLVLPDSYIVDLDQLVKNAKMIKAEGDALGIRLWFMLKQLGRNPEIGRHLVAAGYEGAVAVDFKEAALLMKHGIPIKNVGHLVQIPDGMLERLMTYGAEYMTVYSLEKVKRINTIAKKLGIIQKLLLRVYSPEDLIYSGQTAGFQIREMDQMIAAISQLENVKISGVTSFPCYLFDEKTSEIRKTRNLDTVLKAAAILKARGIEPEIVNTPSSTCTKILKKIKADGGNCGEPGHGLTGTTPEHSIRNLEEVPCVVYLSEISHHFEDHAYCYGGGHYRRSHMENALTGKSLAECEADQIYPPGMESIDYHLRLEKQPPVGVAVVAAFRYQIFVTRSDVVLVKGISSHKPEIVGIYDALGNKK